jgi:hypothetical protein
MKGLSEGPYNLSLCAAPSSRYYREALREDPVNCSASPDECPSQQEMIAQLQASLLEEANWARNPSSQRNELLTNLEHLVGADTSPTDGLN